MKILSFGSMNIDYVYSVSHIVKPGETLHSDRLNTFPGGKGLNQAIAMSRAGLNVTYAGAVGADGRFLLETLKENGVKTDRALVLDGISGHAIIQVDENGQNSIIVFPGTNHKISQEYIDEILSDMVQGDIIVLQNEINGLEDIIKKAYDKNLYIVFNPSPFEDYLIKCGLEKVSLLVVNEIEGEQLTGVPADEPEKTLDILAKKYPSCAVLLTLGADGAWYFDAGERVYCPAVKTTVVDTTSAGDTFLGYFLAGKVMGKSVSESLDLAAKASAITVSRSGASISIPELREII